MRETMTLPQRLRTVRRRLGMTQEDAARRLGVSRFSVNQWELGRHKPMPICRRILELALADWREQALRRERLIDNARNPS